MIVEQVFIPSICFSNAMNAAVDKECTRKAMASFYEDCLCCAGQHGNDCMDWKVLNTAIATRWPKGLTFIKELAWKLLKSRNK